MRRREFIAGLCGAAAWPMATRAQQRAVPTIAFLHNLSPEGQRAYMPAFHRGLAEMGFVDGRNVAIEHHSAEGHEERRQALAADLARRRMAVIIADATNGAQDAKAATQTIPIVFMAGGDPVEFGLVASFNRPGGNLTGIALQGIEISAKRLELLHELVPAAAPIAIFVGTPGIKYTEIETRDLQSAARALGLRVLVINIAASSVESDIAAAFTMLIEQRAGALLLSSNIVFQQKRNQLILLAARHAIPTMFWDSLSVATGALSSCGPDFFDAWHQSGLYTGRILKGDKPADLPVVQPTKFELAFNLKTAKALGLTIPETLLATANKVIE